MMKRTTETIHVEHTLEPVFDERSRVLLIGTMPSPKSRESGFYYGHPQNRFWKTLSRLFDEPLATTNMRKRDQLLRHHIALWDVLKSCSISGASDASIEDAVPNDLSRILDTAPIEAVFCTGAKAAELYERHCASLTDIPCKRLPSTSPANAATSLDMLVEAYSAILPYLREPPTLTLDIPRVIQLEQEIDESGTSLCELMERAGNAIAHRVLLDYPKASVAVLCGNGNNGGDGWVAARELARAGHEVSVICARTPEQLKAQPARDASLASEPILVQYGARILVNPTEEALDEVLVDANVIIDALLGTGFTGQCVKAPFDSWIRAVNARGSRTNHNHGEARSVDEGAGAPVAANSTAETGAHPSGSNNSFASIKEHAQPAIIIAADTPSGLNAQTGTPANPCIRANSTITMMVSKPGFNTQASKFYCGNVRVVPLHYLEPFI